MKKKPATLLSTHNPIIFLYDHNQNQGRSLLKKLGDSSVSWLGLADKEVLIMQEIVQVIQLKY